MSNPNATPTPAEMLKRIAELEAKLAEANKPQPIRFKVSEKGALSVYGLNARFPVTLYRGQWERLIAAIPQLAEFIKTNSGSLAVKASK